MPIMGAIWYALRLRLRWKLEDERRRNRTQIHSSEYFEADQTYETPPSKRRN